MGKGKEGQGVYWWEWYGEGRTGCVWVGREWGGNRACMGGNGIGCEGQGIL